MGRYTKLAASSVFDRSISAEAFRILAALGTYADAEGFCFPSVATIAARLGLKRRQVQRHLRALEAAGFLTTETRKRTDGKGGFGSNVYRVLTEGDASPDDAMPPAKASSDDAMVIESAMSKDEQGVIGRQARRHPKASNVSSEGTIKASSNDALRNPMKEPTMKAPTVKGVASAPPAAQEDMRHLIEALIEKATEKSKSVFADAERQAAIISAEVGSFPPSPVRVLKDPDISLVNESGYA